MNRMFLAKIDWAPSETLFKIASFGVHYYSLMFVIAFGLGYFLMKKIFEKENIPIDYLESLFVYMVVSILLGARLGDVFFYSWDYYQDHLVEILLPIRETPNGYTFTGFRGLASHGAVIGSLIGLYLYKRKFKERPLLWVLDRVTVPVALGASFVRVGNFFNSEIVGKYTGTNFGVVFLNNRETLPRMVSRKSISISLVVIINWHIQPLKFVLPNRVVESIELLQAGRPTS